MPSAGPSAARLASAVATQPLDDTSFDTLIVVASADIQASTPGLTNFCARPWGDIGGICTGAFILAKAGLRLNQVLAELKAQTPLAVKAAS
jgi:transcriptional regulator GlxA family with amidase domain